MATQNSTDTKVTNNADGFDIAGGTTPRKLTVSGGDVEMVGSGAAVITFPSATSELAILGGNTFTGKNISSGVTEVGKTYSPSSGSQTVTIDCALNNMHIVQGDMMGTDITFAIQNATSSQPFIISITQGAMASSTIVGWFATIRWPGGTEPTLTATTGKRDTFGFIRTGADTYDGFIVGQDC